MLNISANSNGRQSLAILINQSSFGTVIAVASIWAMCPKRTPKGVVKMDWIDEITLISEVEKAA